MTEVEGAVRAPRDNLLELQEAVRLCHVMVAHAARKIGVRVFFIKGPASSEMGLRPPKTSIDVDVFVSPADMPSLLSELASRGWRSRPRADELDGFPHHSETVYHDTWPNNIDVHFRFPGMELQAAECFEVLWTETRDFSMANQTIRVPTLELGLIILALHALRTPQEAAEREVLRFLQGLLAELDIESILRIAQASNSLAALRPFLEASSAVSISDWPQPSPEWANLTTVTAPGSAWAVALSAARWRSRPRLLYKAMFPSTHALLGADLYADVSMLGRFRARASRWRKFLTRIPALVQELGKIRKYRQRL